MKRLLLILILTLNFQTLAKADDISDFEIEEISIGDSLLDHFNLEEIKDLDNISYPDKKYIFANLENYGIQYDRLQIGYKNNDNTYEIHLLNGVILFEDNNINKCYSKLNKIKNSIESSSSEIKFSDPSNFKQKLPSNPKEINVRAISASLSNGHIILYCNDHPVENNKNDRLKVQMETSIMKKYLLSQGGKG